MSDLGERLGENVRRLRRRAGISAEELAEHAEISRSHVGNIENGKVDPRVGTLLRLAGVLDSTPDELLDGIAWNPGGREYR